MKKLNPCVTGDTKVWTVEGAKSFKDLANANEDVDVYCLDGDGNIKVSKNVSSKGVWVQYWTCENNIG